LTPVTLILLLHTDINAGQSLRQRSQSDTLAITMFMLGLISWWYGRGWAGVLTSTQRRLSTLSDMFSIKILLNTLFAPWRRIITYPGAGLDARLRAFGDNLVSRCIGFTVRSFVLIAAAVAFLFTCAVGITELILWPLLPFICVALIVKGLL